jgi:hypothetical protein
MKEWVFLLKLIDNLRDQSYKELASFVDGNDAYEKRGKVAGINKVREVIKSLYDERIYGRARESGRESESAGRSTANVGY